MGSYISESVVAVVDVGGRCFVVAVASAEEANLTPRGPANMSLLSDTGTVASERAGEKVG